MLLGAPDVLRHDGVSMLDLKQRGKGPSVILCKTCKERDNDVVRLEKVVEVLRENINSIERENRMLKGCVGEFGSPGNHRKRRSAAAWV